MNGSPASSAAHLSPRSNRLASIALFLGLVALGLSFTCLDIFAIIPAAGAIVCGHISRAAARRDGRGLDGKKLPFAGLVLGYFAVAVTACSVFWIRPAVHKYIVRVATVSLVSEVSKAVQAFNAEYDQWPVAIGSHGEEIDARAALRTLQNDDVKTNPKRIVFLEPAPASIRDGQLIDQWGRPLHIACDLDGDGRIVVGHHAFEQQKTVIWSDGANGLNEFGEGDDIKSR